MEFRLSRSIGALVTFTIAVLFPLLAQAQSRPVIIIPGIMGSKLCDRNNNLVWGDRQSYTLRRLQQIRLPYTFDPKSLEHHACGIIDQISIIPLLWESNVYSGLRTTLTSFGYRSGGDCAAFKDGNIVEFSYDWRLSNFFNAGKLKECIDRLFPDPGIKVDLVAHSMGGMIARVYVQTLRGESRVHNVMMMGTPHLGSAKIFQRLNEGLENWPDRLSGGLTEIQRTVLSFPSTYQLLPSYDDCCAFSEKGSHQDAQYFSAFDPRSWLKFSWLPPELKRGDGAAFVQKQLAEAKQLHDLLRKPVFTDLSRDQPIYVANGFLKTWSRVYFDPRTGGINGHTELEGDKTVLLFSATNSKPRNVRVSHKEHEQVFDGKEPQLVLETALRDRKWTGGEAQFGRVLKDVRGSEYLLRSLGYDAVPRLMAPGSKGSFVIVLRGDERLRAADLSSVTAHLIEHGRNGVALVRALDSTELEGTDTVRKLLFSYVAPEVGGAHRLTIAIPDAETYSEMILVMAPE